MLRVQQQLYATTMPTSWIELHAILQRHAAPELPPPPMPMILAGWFCQKDAKHQRFLEQIEWAENAIDLSTACAFLEALKDTDWDRRVRVRPIDEDLLTALDRDV
jgi:hypothetical protein